MTTFVVTALLSKVRLFLKIAEMITQVLGMQITPYDLWLSGDYPPLK